MKQKYLLKIIPIFLLFNTFSIFSQREITLGTNTNFDSSATSFVRSSRIDDNHILTVFRDGTTTTTSDIQIVVGEISGTTITYGTPVTVESNNNRYASVLVLSSTTAIVSYENDDAVNSVDDSGYSRVITFDTSTDAITNVGAATDIDDDIDAAFSHNPIHMAKLTETTFAMVYSNNSSTDNGTVRIGTVSGSSITFGSGQEFSTGDVQNLWISALSSSKIVVSYENDGSSDKGTAIIGNISGNTVTFGSEQDFSASGVSYTVNQAISDSQFVVVYVKDDANDFMYAKVGTVSGTTVTYSSAEYTLDNSQDTRDISIDYLASKEFVVAYNGGSGDNSKIRLGKVSGTNGTASISFNTEDIFLNSEADDSWVTTLNSDTAVVVYVDDENSDHGEYVVGTLTTNTWTGTTDNDWHTDSNWSVGVPDSFSTVNIPNSLTNYPTATSAALVSKATIQSGASLIAQSTFTGSVSYSRTLTTNWHLVSSPVGSQDINTFTVTDVATNAIATSGANYGVAPYDNNGSAWAYYTTGTIAAAGNFIAGKGYSALRTSAGDITFTGTMPTSDVAIAITDGTANEWNLIGNPYPSYIPANSGADATNNFITVNTADLHASYQAVYFWNGSAYVAVNHADGARFIAPGQGFFVNSVASGSTVDFTEAMQSHQTTDVFSKAQTTWPEIVVHMTDGASDKSTKIKYIPGTTRGLDPGYDAGMFTGVSNAFSVYSHLVSNSEGVDFTLQALPDNDYENISIPIGFNAVSGKEITFSVNHKALPQGLMVFLEDTKDNKIIRLDESNADYKITLTDDNNGIGRFYLRTSTTDLSKTLNVDKFDLSNINIYLSSDRNIRITGVQGQSTNVKLFSILGKRVLNKNNAQTNSIIDVTIPSTVKNGIYILKLETEKGNISKKLFIK